MAEAKKDSEILMEKAAHQKSIILLRGLGRDARHWGEFPKKLAAMLPSYKICTIDLPGTGEYYDIKSPLSVNKMTEFLHKESVKKGYILKDTYIIGLSLGGMVATQWALNYPNSIKKIILVNSSFSNFSRFYNRLSASVYWDFIKMFFMSPEQREVCVLKIVSSNKDQYKEVSQNWKHLWKEKPFKVSTIIRQLVAASLFSLKKLPKQKVLFLASKKDNLVSPVCYKDVESKTPWTVIYNENTGHEMPMDDPDWVINKISEFV